MSSPPNPFPQYPVVGLLDSADGVRKRTIVTPEITSARKLVEDYANGFQRVDRQQQPIGTRRAVIVSISGDYGTGKTHLLLDAIAALQEMIGNTATVLRLVAPEDTPSAWFRVRPNPFLALPLESLIAKLYSQCGAAVAESATLTQQDAARIRSDPQFLFELMRDRKINPSAVDDGFQAQLTEIFGPNVSADVLRAFAALASNITSEQALAWLAGEQVSDEDRSLMRVEQPAAGDAEIFAILVACAALHRRLDVPFALVIDELEHFADFDRSQSEKRNLTWLKRLLEALVPCCPLILVAGHKSAWELEKNLIERFPERIRMLILPPEEITRIVQTFVPQPLTDFSDVATALQEATGGKFRDVLTLCSSLWDETGGFATKPDPSRVRGLSAVDAARAIDEVQGLLQERGYAVRRPGIVGHQIEFDLVASRAGNAEVVFDFKHYITQETPRFGIERFLEKVASVNLTNPAVLACLVAEGNTDQDLRKIAQSTIASKVRYFDSKTHDMLDQVRHALDQLGTAEFAPGPSPAEAILTQARMIDKRLAEATRSQNEPLLNQLREERVAADVDLEAIRGNLDSRNEEFENRLKLLESERHRQYNEIRKRASTAVNDDSGYRGAALAEAIAPRENTIETTYADILDEYSPRRSFRIALARSTFLAAMLVVLAGLALMLGANELILLPSPQSFKYPFEYNRAMIDANQMILLSRVSGFILTVGGMFWLIRQYLVAQRYLEHARRLLRELYIRSARSEDLTTADSILQVLLAKDGPARGMLVAREVLAETFPVFDSSRPFA